MRNTSKPKRSRGTTASRNSRDHSDRRCMYWKKFLKSLLTCWIEETLKGQEQVGAEQARSAVLRTLEENTPCEWEPSLAPDIISLVVGAY